MSAEQTQNGTVISLNLSGAVVLCSANGTATRPPARIERVFQVFTDRDSLGMIRSEGALVWAAQPGSITLMSSQILSLATSGSPTDAFVSPALFHTGQHGLMPAVVFLQPLEMPIAINMGSYPSAQESIGRAAWFALLRGYVSPMLGALGVAGGIEFNGKSTMQAWLTVDEDDIAIVIWLESSINQLNYTVDRRHAFKFPAAFVLTFANADEPGCTMQAVPGPAADVGAKTQAASKVHAAQGSAGWLSFCWDTAAAATHRFAEQHIYPPPPDERYGLVVVAALAGHHEAAQMVDTAV